MRDDDRIRVEHIIDAVEAIGQFVAGRKPSDLDTDRMLLFAVVRAIEVIGEAAGRTSDELRSQVTSVPWRAIVAMGAADDECRERRSNRLRTYPSDLHRSSRT
jgi:uncharacterized protein with HEPN domain